MITDKDFYNVVVSIRESKGFDTTEKTRFRQRADRRPLKTLSCIRTFDRIA